MSDTFNSNSNIIHGSELSTRQAQSAVANMAMQAISNTGLSYLITAAMYQATATIASVMKNQFPGTTIEPARQPHQKSDNALGNEAGLQADAGVEAHPILEESVQHDGVAPDNNRENAVTHESDMTREKLETTPVHQLTPELQNKLAKQQSPSQTHVASPSPLK